jgi:hypothetical protein
VQSDKQAASALDRGPGRDSPCCGPACLVLRTVRDHVAGDWVFHSSLGTGSAGGGYGEFLEKPVTFDLNLSKGRGSWRFGGGFSFDGLAMKPPYEDQKEWARLETYFFARHIFNNQGRVRPYLQARLGLERIHPRSELFYVTPPEEVEAGHNPTNATNGFGFTLEPGIELGLNRELAFDVSGWWTAYKTGSYDLEPIGKEPVSSGQEWGVRAGFTWRPLPASIPELPPPVMDPATGKLSPLPPADGHRDAWGVPRSWGWAVGEMLGIDFVATALNEYTRGESSYPVEPRSFWYNIQHGWEFDDNVFKTNQLVHPFNGATYFNAGRANGVGFWGSSGLALAGAFLWECCGESQPMSWNDMIATGIGGMARGEVSYRLASLILDNTKSGKKRLLREIAALPVNPIGQFNRFVSGRATTVQGNPDDPYEWRPPNLTLQLAVGGRVIGEGESITQNTNYYGFVEFDALYGSAFENERHKPFDRFDTAMQLNLGDKTRMGRVSIRGDLWAKPLGGDADHPANNSIAITQDFDYIDNEAFEYGGQSFGLTWYSRFGKGKTRLTTRLVGYGVVMGAVNADYSYLADVPNPRELRNYDYGPGVGGGVEMLLSRQGRPIATLTYRYTLLAIENGSIYTNSEGSNARHQIHRVGVRVDIPVSHRIAIGADWFLFFRNSHYDSPELEDKSQRNPEARLSLVWNWGH